MKQQRWLWTIVAMVLFALGILFAYSRPGSVSVLKIGALLPLTGKFANLGEDIRNGLELARMDIKKSNGLDLEILYEDSGGDPKLAVTAANKLVKFDKVDLIIAGPGSSANLAVLPALNRGKDDAVVFIAISSTPKLNVAGRHVVKANHDIDIEAKRMAEYLLTTGVHTVGIMFDATSDTLITGKDVFKKVFTERGGKVLNAEGYDGKGVPDFKAQLVKLKEQNPDALYFLAIEKLAGPMVRQAREIGLRQSVFGFSALESAEFLKGAGEFAEGVSFSALPFSCEGSARMKQFCADYAVAYGGRSPLAYGAYGYDLLTIISGTVTDGKLDRESVISAFEGRTHQGINGALVFDQDGNIQIPSFPIRTVQDGKFVEVK